MKIPKNRKENPPEDKINRIFLFVRFYVLKSSSLVGLAIHCNEFVGFKSVSIIH